MIGNKQFKYQESIWGYRYMYKTFQDENKFGSSADLGVNGEIKVTENLKINLFVLNGEGYKKYPRWWWIYENWWKFNIWN